MNLYVSYLGEPQGVRYSLIPHAVLKGVQLVTDAKLTETSENADMFVFVISSESGGEFPYEDFFACRDGKSSSSKGCYALDWNLKQSSPKPWTVCILDFTKDDSAPKELEIDEGLVVPLRRLIPWFGEWRRDQPMDPALVNSFPQHAQHEHHCKVVHLPFDVDDMTLVEWSEIPLGITERDLAIVAVSSVNTATFKHITRSVRFGARLSLGQALEYSQQEEGEGEEGFHEEHHKERMRSRIMVVNLSEHKRMLETELDLADGLREQYGEYSVNYLPWSLVEDQDSTYIQLEELKQCFDIVLVITDTDQVNLKERTAQKWSFDEAKLQSNMQTTTPTTVITNGMQAIAAAIVNKVPLAFVTFVSAQDPSYGEPLTVPDTDRRVFVLYVDEVEGGQVRLPYTLDSDKAEKMKEIEGELWIPPPVVETEQQRQMSVANSLTLAEISRDSRSGKEAEAKRKAATIEIDITTTTLTAEFGCRYCKQSSSVGFGHHLSTNLSFGCRYCRAKQKPAPVKLFKEPSSQPPPVKLFKSFGCHYGPKYGTTAESKGTESKGENKATRPTRYISILTIKPSSETQSAKRFTKSKPTLEKTVQNGLYYFAPRDAIYRFSPPNSISWNDSPGDTELFVFLVFARKRKIDINQEGIAIAIAGFRQDSSNPESRYLSLSATERYLALLLAKDAGHIVLAVCPETMTDRWAFPKAIDFKSEAQVPLVYLDTSGDHTDVSLDVRKQLGNDLETNSLVVLGTFWARDPYEYYSKEEADGIYASREDNDQQFKKMLSFSKSARKLTGKEKVYEALMPSHSKPLTDLVSEYAFDARVKLFRSPPVRV